MAVDLPERVLPMHPKLAPPALGKVILSSFRVGIPNDLESTLSAPSITIMFRYYSMDNKFLRDFMKRQATLIESGIPEASGGAGGPPTKKKNKKHKSKYGTADGKAPFGGDDMASRFTAIITELPAKKELLAYFRDRIAELVANDDFC